MFFWSKILGGFAFHREDFALMGVFFHMGIVEQSFGLS